MKTIVTASPAEAAEFVRAGEVAAFPTETVYGLGADAYQTAAVRKIFDAKVRPSDNPLIVHICDRSQVDIVAAEIGPSAARLIEHFFPGPLTLVVRRAPGLPDIVTAGLDTVGIRMPAHDQALAFLRACRTPVAAPSANRSGKPSPTTWQAVLEDLDGRIPCILEGSRAEVGLESTVVDCSGTHPVILRSGALGLETLQRVVPDIRHDDVRDESVPRSPGLRHRHYAPSARVVPVSRPPNDPTPQSAFIGLTKPEDHSALEMHRVCRDLEEYAYELFDFFRRCDAAGIRTIYCECPPEEGLGVALADRLRRAAEPAH